MFFERVLGQVSDYRLKLIRLEPTIISISAKCVDHVMCEAERDKLRLVECQTLYQSARNWGRRDDVSYFVEKTIEINMEHATGSLFEQDILAMPVSQSVGPCQLKSKTRGRCTYPRTCPTMDMTAQDRVYRSLATNHDPASGNISTNHSCKTGGNLSLY